MKHLIFFTVFLSLFGCFQNYSAPKKVKKDSILSLEVQGIITSSVSQEFMEQIRRYMKNPMIKGLLVRIDSPGGTVGASQEINEAIKEVRDLYKKPVVVSAGDIMASGGIYSAVSADQIIVNKGSLLGSIGALMVFKNVSELIRWAKMDIYSIKAGEFKDSGSPFREMTLREREIFENLMEDVLEQFKSAIVEGRGLDPKVVEAFTDGRVFTGEYAVQIGLADKTGFFNEAIKVIGELTGLGSAPELFSPSKDKGLFKYLGDLDSKAVIPSSFERFLSFYRLSGKPLYIMPSYLSVR
ncbi:MAG: signal peptide peptidase SppA [Bdellovibrionales bacterium]|nr:signal peptide peptidase SppA [Bdellovibrionales bacterium]